MILVFFSSAGNDGLDLMRSQVLSFVYNEDYVRQTPPTDVSQGTDGDLSFLLHLINGTVLLFVRTELAFDEVQIVPKRAAYRG